MDSKFKNALTFSEAVDVNATMNTILNLVDITTKLYSAEEVQEAQAYLEATNLVFSKKFAQLNDQTPAQWIALGYSESKAIDVITHLISEIFADVNKKAEEQRVILARVFTK